MTRIISLILATALLVAGGLGTPKAEALTPAQVRVKVNALKNSVAAITAQLNTSERELASATASIQKHQASLARARKDHAALNAGLADRIAEIYISAGLTREAEIATTDIGTYVDRMNYLENMERGQEGLLERIDTLRRNAAEESLALREARERATAATTRLRAKQRNFTARLREIESLERFLASASRGASRASRSSGRGILCPVVGSNVVVNNFGDPRPGGPHQGNDIRANTGQAVRAVLPGKIVDNPYGSWWGIGIVMRDLAGNEWWYAHLSRDYVSVGQKVSQGEVLGRVGCTGNCYGPHLHFEYHPNGGRAIDPYRILTSAC